MIPVVKNPEVVAQKEKLLKASGPAYVVLLPSAFLDVLSECCKKCDSNGDAKLFKGSIKKHKQSCPNKYHYDDLTVQYEKDKQVHEDVLGQISQKDVPDFIDPQTLLR